MELPFSLFYIYIALVRCKDLLPIRFAKSKLKIASYLVDPASSHMLVSKIKPCMSKYKPP